MPVFHTKTIESILEPIAQQISKLVILNEEADNGSPMPDLSLPLQVVQQAAENLIKVGHQTCETTEDSWMQNELPDALNRVKKACEALEMALVDFKSDSKSPFGKRKLVEGERGILQGISAILFILDQSQVRKIINSCEQVIEYLSITELIEKTEDLVTYIKNLTPVLAKMTREVDSREKELTNSTSREILCEHLEQVKNLIPSFISSIKVVLILNSSIETNDKQLIYFAVENKDFLIKQLTYEINEIINVLKLTSFDRNLSDHESFILLKNEINNFESNSKKILEWLSNKNLANDSREVKDVQKILKNFDSLMEKLDENENKKLYDLLKNCQSVIKNLLNSDKNDNFNIMGENPSEFLCNQLNEIMNYLDEINSASDKSWSCLTFIERLELTLKWLRNPTQDDFQIGELAARSIIHDSKKILSKETNIDDGLNFEKFIDRCDYMIDEFINMSNDIKLDRIAVKSAAKKIQDSLSFIIKRINRLMIQKFADQFYDFRAPLHKLNEIVQKSSDQIIDEKFNEASIDFLDQSEKLCEITSNLSLSTNYVKTRNTTDRINRLTKRIKELSPQIVNSGYTAIKFPGDSNFDENFQLLSKKWETNISTLQKVIDDIIDSESFIIACEKSIIKKTYETQDAVLEKNASVIVNNALSIAQKTNRILKITSHEIENSEDKIFVDRILISNDKLRKSLPYFIHSAKSLALDPSNKENYLIWASSNEQLIDAIAAVRESISNNDNDSNRSFISNDDYLNSYLTQFDHLRINEELSFNSHQPKYKPLPVSRPTPLPDLIEENENEFPEPQNNQPILMAAHDLHYSINQWYTTDNDIIAVAKRITFLMAKLSELVRGQNRSNKKLIDTSKQLYDESLEICRLARLIAEDCTDKRMKLNLLQICERIPTIGTQLKILSTVKATMLGFQGSKEDAEATEMLIINAQNLNSSIKETIRAAKSASIKLKPGSALKYKWIRKKSFESNILGIV